MLSRLWWVIPVAVILATAADLVFFFALSSALEKPLLFPNEFPPPELAPLGIADIVMFSLIFSAGASLVFVVIANVSGRPVSRFLTVSLIVLVLSFALPLSIPSPPVAIADKLCLVAMHIIGAVFVVGTLVILGSVTEEPSQL